MGGKEQGQVGRMEVHLVSLGGQDLFHIFNSQIENNLLFNCSSPSSPSSRMKILPADAQETKARRRKAATCTKLKLANDLKI